MENSTSIKWVGKSNSLKNKITGVGLVLWLLYLLSIFIPEPLWGFHYLSFLPPFFTYGILGLSLFFILYFHKNTIKLTWLEKYSFNSWYWIVAISLITSFFYYNLPMYESVYGDAELFQEKMGERTDKFSSKYVQHLLEVDFSNPKLGNTTVLSGVRLLSYRFGISHKEAFRWVGAFAGFCWVLILVLFLSKYIINKHMRWLLMLMALVAPFSQLFMGYEEVYAIAFPAAAAYFSTLFMCLKSKKKWLLIVLPLLFLICLKTHSVFILLAPSLLLTFLFKFRWLERIFTWKSLIIILLVPFFIFGAFVYFVILKDYNDPRFLGADVDIYTRLFLPILSPEAPLDRYNLFSWSHFLDYFNMIFLWSGSVFFMLLVVVILLRKKIEWNKPEVLISGISFLMFVMVYFAYNPLMSMPIDFDLFSLVAPIFLFFVISLLAQIKDLQLTSYLAGPVFGLTLLVIPIYLVNADNEALSNRMESLGVHVFKTYWIRSAGDVDAGIEMQKNIDKKYISRYLDVIKKLEPYALKNNDAEYAILLWKVAMYYRNDIKDYDKALSYHLQVLIYDNQMKANYIGLMESHYYLKQFDEAYLYSKNLINLKYPNEQKAYQIAIDCAIQAKFYDKALQYLNFYIYKWDDVGVRKTRKDLEIMLEQNGQIKK